MRVMFQLVIVSCVVLTLGMTELPVVNLEEKRDDDENAPPPIDGSVLKLNRFTLKGNVHQPNPYVKQWVVLYCVPWFQPCQDAQLPYNDAAMETSNVYNVDMHLTGVQFAQVDCSTEKVLCNEMGATFFPFFAIYEGGNQSRSWLWSGRGSASAGSAWAVQQLSQLRQAEANRQLQASLEPGPFAEVLTQCGAILKECGAMLKASWLGQMWDALDTDARDVVFVLAVSCTLWAVFKNLTNGARPVDSTIKKPDVQHMNGNEVIAKASFLVPGELRKRQRQPNHQRSLSQARQSVVL